VKVLAESLGLDAEALMSLPSAGKVALMFDYDACWSLDIQPQSRAYRYLFWCYRLYEALRELGLSVDIISSEASLDAYELLVLPAQAHISPALQARLTAFNGVLLAGPRTGSKTDTYQIPDNLAPGPLASLLPLTVERVDALPNHTQPAVSGRWGAGNLMHWHEQIKTTLPCLLKDDGGNPVLMGEGRHFYLGSCIDNGLLKASLAKLAEAAGLSSVYLPKGVRVRERGNVIFAFNYASHEVFFEPEEAELVIGDRHLAAAGVSIWKKR
jgi:beta-galactosidase